MCPDESFTTLKCFTNHRRIVHKDDVICRKCGAQLTANGFKAHMATHHADRRYVCDICGSMFKVMNALKDHKLLHSAVPQFQCTECPKRFRQRQGLRRHLLVIHNPEVAKNLLCEDCGYKTADKIHLIEHMRQHTGERPFQCKLCDKRYTIVSILLHNLNFIRLELIV